MKSIERLAWLMPVLLFSLAGCGLKGPLYLPDDKQQQVPAGTPPAKRPAVGGKVLPLPPAPQSQKKDRERSTTPAPTNPGEQTLPPVSPPDPDRPATTTPPPGQ